MMLDILNYPDRDLIKKLWAEGGAQAIEDQLGISWFSVVELKLNDTEILRSVVHKRYREDLAIPFGEFWHDWVLLLSALKYAQLAETKFWPSENIEDSLRFRGEKIDYEGNRLVISIIDAKNNSILSSALSSYKELVEETIHFKSSIVKNLTSSFQEMNLPIDKEPVNFDKILSELK